MRRIGKLLKLIKEGLGLARRGQASLGLVVARRGWVMFWPGLVRSGVVRRALVRSGLARIWFGEVTHGAVRYGEAG